MFKSLFHRFSAKVFLTYLVILTLVFLIIAVALALALPGALGRHMAGGMMSTSGMMDERMRDPQLTEGLLAAANEAFFLAGVAALLAALGLSAWLSRQLAAPLGEIARASQELAAGYYEKRVSINQDAAADPDEITELALSFNNMAAELEQTENLRRQLIGDVSHELRTPLTAIKGYMEGLLDGVLPADQETFQQVHREADRLQRLVADLQELSRVEAGNFELERRPVSVEELFRSLQKRMSAQFKEKAVQLKIIGAEQLPAVYADEDRLGQVLLNLASNALQFTPEGGTVTLAAAQQNGAVKFVMADTGIGIPAEHLPHIFSRFYRVDKSRSRQAGGSGIGLTIAKHLVEAHGGRIWVENAERGSTFSFTIPLQ